MSGLAELWIAMLAGLVVFAASGAGLAVTHRIVIIHARRLPPNVRAAAMFGLLVAPLVLASVTVAVTTLSTHASFFDIVGHHCHETTASCTAHAPASSSALLMAIGAGLLTGAALWIGLTLLDSFLRASDQWRLLRAASTREGDTFVLTTDDVVAVSGGIFKPAPFVSRGLRQHLSDLQYAIVRAHEAAHGERGDNLVRIIAAAFSVGHWPGAARALQAELALAQEQACDRAAARAFGAIETAETLLAVEKLQRSMRAPPACYCPAYLDTAIEARTRALLSPSFMPSQRAVVTVFAATLIALLITTVSAEPLHHEIETLILILQS